MTPRWVSTTYYTSPRFDILSVNGQYSYTFKDASDSFKVHEFIKEFFNPVTVESVAVLDSARAVNLHGTRGEFGVVTIALKENATFNPKVAGLTTIVKVRRKYRKCKLPFFSSHSKV